MGHLYHSYVSLPEGNQPRKDHRLSPKTPTMAETSPAAATEPTDEDTHREKRGNISTPNGRELPTPYAINMLLYIYIYVM